jgi:hypothetical protein
MEVLDGNRRLVSLLVVEVMVAGAGRRSELSAVGRGQAGGVAGKRMGGCAWASASSDLSAIRNVMMWQHSAVHGS